MQAPTGEGASRNPLVDVGHDFNVADVPSSTFPCQTELYDDVDTSTQYDYTGPGTQNVPTSYTADTSAGGLGAGYSGNYFAASFDHEASCATNLGQTTVQMSTDASNSSGNRTSYMELPPRVAGHMYGQPHQPSFSTPQEYQPYGSLPRKSAVHSDHAMFKMPLNPTPSPAFSTERQSTSIGAMDLPSVSHRQMATSLTEASQRTAAFASQLHEARDEVSVLKEMLLQRDQQYKQVTETLRDREADIDKAKDTVQTLAAEIELHKGKHVAAEERTAELEQLYTRATQEAQKALATAQQCAERAERDAGTARARGMEVEELRQTVSQREAEVATLRNRVATLDTEHSAQATAFARKCDGLVAEWQGVLDERDQEAQQARQEVEGTRKRMAAMESTHADEKKELRVLLETSRDALSTTVAERAELERALRALRTQHDAFKLELESVRSLHADELRDVHDTLARERRRLEMLTSNGSALMSELEDKKAALRRHDDEMRQYKRSLAQAEVEVQQGKNARSIVEAQIREIDAARDEIARESDARARVQRELEQARAACADKDATLAQVQSERHSYCSATVKHACQAM